MRKAGRVVAEMHARIRDAIRPGVTTGELDQVGPRRHRQARRSLQLPELRRRPPVPGRHLRLAQRRDRPRHPRHVPPARRATSSRSTAGRSSRATTATPPSPPRSARSPRRPAGLIKVTEESLFAGIEQMVDGNRISDIGHAVQKRGRGRRLRRGAGVHRPRHRHRHARDAPGAQLRRARQGRQAARRQRLRHRAHGQRRWARDRGCSTTAGACVTADGSLSAHFEHTIAITDNGPEILTLP